MIKKKTSVLIASSIKMGGIINQLDSGELDILYDIGLNLGIAFQIQDDYLDLFGDEKIIGKSWSGCGQQQKNSTSSLVCEYRIRSTIK